MSTALIGYSGFVGGNLLAQMSFKDLYNSKNIGEIAGKDYELIVCAGAPAAMWIANNNPTEDWSNIQRLIQPLSRTTSKHFVLISTIAVYPEPVNVNEHSRVDAAAATPYGRHRYALEQFVSDHFSSTIVRLPGLFGEGIKKNVIFDLLNQHNLEMINSGSVYQFYNLKYLTRDINRALQNEIPLLNVSSAPIVVDELARECFGLDFHNNPTGSKPACFDYKSKYASLWGGLNGYLYSKDQVLADISSFIAQQRAGTLVGVNA